MLIDSILKTDNEMMSSSSAMSPIVLSTRVRLARNLMNFSFPGWAKKSEKNKILNKCLEALKDIEIFKSGTLIKVEELNEIERLILVERHMISRELINNYNNTGVFINEDHSCAIMLNEEDHLRIQYIERGYKFNQIWNSINSIDDEIEQHLDYAFSDKFGYLTACPTNVGTGLRASAMLHLPGLVISNHMEKCIRALNQTGIAVRGLFGEGSDASGSIFQISNQQTLGDSEKSIIKRLTIFLTEIIEQENNSRQNLLETQPLKLADKIGRAYGVLQNSLLLSSAEAMDLLSVLRLAIDLKLLDESYRNSVDNAFIECQPGHIQFKAKTNIDSSTMRDKFRANYLRTQFDDLPPLNFDVLNI